MKKRLLNPSISCLYSIMLWRGELDLAGKDQPLLPARGRGTEQIESMPQDPESINESLANLMPRPGELDLAGEDGSLPPPARGRDTEHAAPILPRKQKDNFDTALLSESE